MVYACLFFGTLYFLPVVIGVGWMSLFDRRNLIMLAAFVFPIPVLPFAGIYYVAALYTHLRQRFAPTLFMAAFANFVMVLGAFCLTLTMGAEVRRGLRDWLVPAVFGVLMVVHGMWAGVTFRHLLKER
jgi:hypothetical protein